MSFFPDVEPIRYAPESEDLLVFRHYDAERVVLGKTLREHARFAVCFWHTFCWPGSDVFGAGTFERAWLSGAGGGDAVKLAEKKIDAAFELFAKLGVPFFCFHDRDVAPEGDTLRESHALLDRLLARVESHMDRHDVRLLWGTANLFGHPRYAAGAATNPDPEVFAYAAAQVKHCLEATHRLGGANYVLWGGREGYDTLLNTDLAREADQLGRFLALVAEHKHRIGFRGTLLIEPKPFEPTKHQYDFDAAAVFAFLQKYDLAREYKLNLEVNHATLAGHDFQHEVAYAVANGIFGSVDANRGDPRLGWDTDQFPNDPREWALAWLEILRGGGMHSGGFNFDAKLRRPSVDAVDLFHAHVGGMDTIARGLVAAAAILEDGRLERFRAERYLGWDQPLGRDILAGRQSLEDLAGHVLANDLEPQPDSGRQEMLENLVARFV
ncbi:MAG: xylose isomerase [Proteobacteria bacterium]|nr:MAG: xylose isomerase [Pseudomonadota bacterium]